MLLSMLRPRACLAAALSPPSCVASPLRALATAPSRAALIKEVRARTSAPMKKVVEALNEADGDVEEAMTLLRKMGVSAAAKKASRGANEGAAAVAHASGVATMVEINSETDFVARNDIFQGLAASVARTALALAPEGDAPSAPIDTASIGAATLDGGDTSVTEAMGVAVSQVGENLVLRRAIALRAPASGGVVATYIHNEYAPGVGRTASAIVLASTAGDADALRALGQKLAMHVVAATPQYLDRDSVDTAAVQRERDILLEQAQSSGKPADVIEKMVTGRLNKFYGEVCLLEQTYMIDETQGSIAKVLAAAGKELGAPVELAAFARFRVGEETASVESE